MHLLLVRHQLPLNFLCIIFQLVNRVSEHLSQVIRFVQRFIHCLGHPVSLNWNEIEGLGNGHEAFGDENCRRVAIPNALLQHVEALHEQVGDLEDDSLGLILSELLVIVAVLVRLGTLAISRIGLQNWQLLGSLLVRKHDRGIAAVEGRIHF